MPDAQKLSNPPKFGSQGTPSPSPRTIGDWMDFWRWLTSLWAVARESINFPEARAIIPPSARGASLDESIGAGFAFRGNPPSRASNADLGAILATQRSAISRPQDELTGLVQMALSRQSPLRQLSQGSSVLIGTHADRLLLTAGDYVDGTLFYETDREVFYIVQAATWVWSAGYMRDLVANQPTDLGVDDAGFMFLGTDNLFLYYWDAALWVQINPPGPPSSTFIPQERIVAAATAIALTDFAVIGVNSSGSSYNFTLPTAAAAGKQVFLLMSHRTSTSPIVIVPTGGNTINGQASYTLSATESVFIQSDTSSDWNIELATFTTLTLQERILLTGTTVTLEDFTVIGINFTGSSVNFALPSAASSGKQLFLIKSHRLSTNPIVVVPNGADTISGAASFTLNANDCILIQSDTATDWNILILSSTAVAGVSSLTNGGSISLSASIGAVTIAVSDPAWTAWTPTVTAVGSVSTSVLDASIIVTGKTAKFRIYWEGTLGTASTFINFTLPVTPKAVASPGFQTCASAYFNAGVGTYITAGVLNSGSVATRGATLPTVVTLEVALEGTFEIN